MICWQVLACWLRIPSHYLNQCWVIISEINAVTFLWGQLHKKYFSHQSLNKLEISVKYPKGQWVKSPRGGGQHSEKWHKTPQNVWKNYADWPKWIQFVLLVGQMNIPNMNALHEIVWTAEQWRFEGRKAGTERRWQKNGRTTLTPIIPPSLWDGTPLGIAPCVLLENVCRHKLDNCVSVHVNIFNGEIRNFSCQKWYRIGNKSNWLTDVITDTQSGIYLCMRPANEGRRYNVTPSLIGWVRTQNDPCSAWAAVVTQ